MITKNNIVPISKMRSDTKAVLKKLRSCQPLYLFSRSTPQAVLLGIDDYAAMQEIIEGYFDSQELLSISQKEINEADDFEKIATKSGK